MSTRVENAERRPGLLFGRLFSGLFGRVPEQPSVEERGALQQIARDLQEIAGRAEGRLCVPGALAQAGPADHTVPADAILEARSRLRNDRDAERAALEAQIVRLHGQLETGIDAAMMERLRHLLTTHAPADTDPSRVSIEERIEQGVLHHLFRGAAEAAWERLEKLMARSGLTWPVRSGVPNGLASEELQRTRGRHLGEVRSAFLAATPRQQADLIQGEVRAWVYGYPARDSYLWLQTAIRAVAAALCAQFFAAALELWMWRPRELDAKLLYSVNEGIEPARAAIRAGIQTVAEATDVTALVGAACDRIIPSMVWDYVAPKLEWVRAGGRSPDVSVLAAGLAQVDPVCGMSLTSDRVAARLDVEEEPVYFCSLSCRQRFEEMNPQRSDARIEEAR